MSFVRPELAAAFQRRREAIVWGATLAAGALLLWRGYARVEPVTFVAGAALAVAGFALGRGALGRMRLGAAGPAPGLVVIDEGRIGLMGPDGGGFVDLDELALVAVDGAAGGAGRRWRLVALDGAAITIPFGAVGAERLPDTLAALPGIDFDAAGGRGGVVWRRSGTATTARAILH
jgi:hypothetical protein